MGSAPANFIARYPVAVIGAGAGGLAAATALAEAGFKVVLVERGPNISANEFTTDRYDYETAAQPWREGNQEWDGPVPVQRALGIGGSTLVFQAVTRLAPDPALAVWGLPVSTIRRYADDIQRFLRIAGADEPAHPLNPVSTALHRAAQRLGWRSGPTPVAILSRDHEGRPACNYCGLCVFGCRIGDKGSTNNTWLPRALRSGNLEIIAETRVEALHLGSASQVTALRIRGPGGQQALNVSAVVLAAGALETPYLLKNSHQTLAPNGLGSRAVGRYLTSTVWQSLLVALPEPLSGGHAGIPIDLLIDEFENRGIRLAQGRNLAGIVGPISAARYYSRYRGPLGLRSWMRTYYPRLAGLAAFAESSTTYEDGITFGGGKRFSMTLHKSDVQTMTESQRLLRMWADSAKAEVLFAPDAPMISGAMLRGSCRIGTDPETSAVSPDGRLRGYENIVVADASVLGRGLISDPSFTIQVLGYHFGRELAERLRNSA